MRTLQPTSLIYGCNLHKIQYLRVNNNKKNLLGVFLCQFFAFAGCKGVVDGHKKASLLSEAKRLWVMFDLD